MVQANNAPALASNQNIFLLTSYIYFHSLGYNIGNAIGFLKYLQDWGLTINGMVNATLLGFIVKFCCQLAVGYFGDKLKSKYGRRKPFLVAGYIVKGISLLLLSSPPTKSGVAVFGWYTLFYVLFQFGTELGDSPFDAWMIEITKDDEDYRKIYSVAGPIGGFMGGISGLLLVLFFPLVGSFVFIVGSGIFTYLVVTWISAPVARKTTLPELVPSLRICARTNEFKSVFCLRVLVDSGVNIFVTVVGYYVLIGFDLEKVSSYVNYLLYGSIAGACIGIPLTVMMNWVLYWYDKITLYLILVSFVIVLGILAFIITTPGLNSFEGYFILLCLMNTLSYPAKLFDRLIIRDLVTYDSFMTGLHRENMYFVALTLPTTILSTFIGGIPAMIIMFCGYSEDTDVDDDEIDKKYDWTTSTLWLLRISGSFAFSFLAFLAFLILRRYPLTSAVAQQMNVVNKRRDEERRQEEIEDKALAELNEDEAAGTVDGEKNPLQISLLESDHLEHGTPNNSDDDSPSDAVRYLFLHLSAEELYFVTSFSSTPSTSFDAHPIDNSSLALSLQNFYLIQFLNSSMLYLGILATICVVAVIAVDISTQDGSLSTLFINVLMILIFFVLYSFFRYRSMKQIQQLFHLTPFGATDSTASLSQSTISAFHTAARLIYCDFTQYHVSLKKMLKKEEIVTDLYSKDHSSSLVDPIVEEEEGKKLNGFKRIFTTLAVIIAISIALICVPLV